MGTLLFIFLGVVILFMSLAFFFIGRNNGLKQAKKIANSCYLTDTKFSISTFEKLTEYNKTDCIPFIVFSFYIAFFALLFFIGECNNVHDNIINKYNNGDYVQVEDTRSFVTADSTKFEKTAPVRYYTKKEFEHIVKKGKLNKIN